MFGKDIQLGLPDQFSLCEEEGERTHTSCLQVVG
jgi:hypothetical protein